MTKYLIRLDDACPEMNHSRWNLIFQILDKYSIKPLIGIIPHNEDSDTMIDSADPNFWQMMREKHQRGWAMALHGYNHVCQSHSGGINPVHQRSEFAGADLCLQKDKIKSGYNILVDNGIIPEVFFAPSHTFDRNTLEALKSETPIRTVSDTFALRPYIEDDITFIPQQMGKFRNIPLPGYWTFCFHPNIMTDAEMQEFEDFIKRNRNSFISYKEVLDIVPCKRSIIDLILQKLYLMKRK